MKHLLFSLFVLVGTMFVSTAFAQVNLVNSPHNLSISGTGDIHATVDDGTGSDEICVYCHTPHQADNSAPLWNRTYNPGAGGAWTFYTSPTHDAPNGAGVAVLADLQGQSLACLSCHDGSTALDSLINAPGTGAGSTATWTITDNATGKLAGTTFAPGAWANTTRDLTDDHPVGIDYTVAQASDGTGPGSGGFLDSATLVDVVLYNDKVECASCHNPHDWDGAADDTRMFLRAQTAASTICLRCHAK